MSYQTTIRDLPLALRRLRLKAGHKTQSSALREIRRRTGVSITPTRMSDWERGRSVPSLRSMIAFLTAFGYDFQTLQREIEQDAAETPAPRPVPKPPAPAAPKPPAPTSAPAPAVESPEERWQRLERELKQQRRAVPGRSKT